MDWEHFTTQMRFCSPQEYEVEAIIGHMVDTRHKIEWFLIKWKNYPEDEATWEPIQNLGNCLLLIQTYLDEFHAKKNQ